METSGEKFIHLPDSTRICYQTFGNPSDPTIILISGGAQSMLSWPEDFILMLTPPSNRHFIVRYDIRDTGRSTSYPLSQNGNSQNKTVNYTLNDLCNDALAILDHLRVEAANFVGFSLGGGIAWIIAAKQPHRVKSLSLLSTTPIGPFPGAEEGLPTVDADLIAQMSAGPYPDDWHNKDQVVRFLTYFDNCMAYNHPTQEREEEEEEENRRQAERVFDRAEMEHSSVQRIFNQAGAAQSRWPRELLKNVKCPTVIIHGRQDRNLSLPHAYALNQEIEGSKLVIYEDIAHEMPRRIWNATVREILDICN
jgi:pimeloyl-ACP methyl ester carboxylesterase